MPVSLSHVTISSAQFADSMAFYDAALGALGLVRTAEFGDEEESDVPVEAAGWGETAAEPIMWLVAASAATVTRGAHVAVRASSRAAVEAFFAAGLGQGGRSLRPPRRWTIYRRGQFAATLLDPDGNRVEAVAAE